MFCQSKLFHIFVNNHTYMTQTLAWSWWKVWVTLQVKGRLRGCFAFFPTNLLSFRLLSWDGKRHEKCPDHLLSYFQYSVLLSSAETLLSPLKKVNNLEMFLSTYVCSIWKSSFVQKLRNCWYIHTITITYISLKLCL